MFPSVGYPAVVGAVADGLAEVVGLEAGSQAVDGGRTGDRWPGAEDVVSNANLVGIIGHISLEMLFKFS